MSGVVPRRRPWAARRAARTEGSLTHRGALLLAPILFAFVVFYLFPLAQLLVSSFRDGSGWTLQYYQSLLNDPVALIVFINTVKLAATVTLVTLVVAYPLAFLMSARGGWVGSVLLAAILFPFWISILVRTYAWMVLLGREGVLNSLLMWLGLLNAPLELLYNRIGVHIGMVYVLLPLMTLPIYSSMQNFDRNLIRAAHSLGCGPIESLRRVYVPLTMPGVAAGSLLVFMMSLGFFITPAIMGGTGDITIAMLVEQTVNQDLNWSSGAAMSSVLLLITLTIFVGSRRILQRGSGDKAHGALVG